MSPLTFVTLAAIHALAVMSPGPTFVVQLRTAVSHGFGRAAVAALGFGVGAAIWGGAALMGLAALFQIAPVLLTGLKVLGGLFLIFIGAMMWRHAAAPLPDLHAGGAAPALTARRAFQLGVLTSMSNPKVAVFFGAVFVGLVPPTATTLDFALILALVIVVESLWYIAVGGLFSAPQARAVYERAKAGIDRAFGGVLTLLGLRIMIS